MSHSTQMSTQFDKHVTGLQVQLADIQPLQSARIHL